MADPIKTQRVLSTTNITLADYVINPYRGCAFGCLYCYAQKNKNHNESCRVYAKINAPEILEKELRFAQPKRVLLGSTTECFQDCERELKVTEKVLTVLNKKNIPYTILTKSHRVQEYSELIAKNKQNKIYFTVNFHDQKTINALEKNSSPLALRLEAIKKLIAKNIDLRIHAGPFIPGLSDLSRILNILPEGVREMDIEIYHEKMGNLAAIIAAAKTLTGEATAEKIAAVYASPENYLGFAETVRKAITAAKQTHEIKFYLLIPRWGEFYENTLDYETTLV